MSKLSAKLNKYHITEEQYNALLLQRSGNKCEICGKHPGEKALAVDHCHRNGKVRGLLCMPCNRFLIGKMGDRVNAIELFTKALEYLKRAE